MPFHVPINILDFIFKGMLIGVIASAPMGPVGILCVQRTLNKGRWYGMVTGFGAAASDIIYAGISGFGMSFVMDFITNDQNRFYTLFWRLYIPLRSYEEDAPVWTAEGYPLVQYVDGLFGDIL